MREVDVALSFSGSNVAYSEGGWYLDDSGRMYKMSSIYGYSVGESSAPSYEDVMNGNIGPEVDSYLWSYYGDDTFGENKAKVVKTTVQILLSEEEAAALEITDISASADGTQYVYLNTFDENGAHVQYSLDTEHLNGAYIYEMPTGVTVDAQGNYVLEFSFVQYLPDAFDPDLILVDPPVTGGYEGSPIGVTDQTVAGLPRYEVPIFGTCSFELVLDEVSEEPKHTTYTVFKIWNSTPTDAIPEAVSIQLYCDGEIYGPLVSLTAANSWTHKFEHLEDLEEHVWSIEEYTPAGFASEINYSDYAAVIINTYTVAPLMSYYVVAVWDDEAGDPRPESVNVQLQYEDMIYNEEEGPVYIDQGSEVTLRPQANWRYEYENLSSSKTWRVIPVTKPANYVISVSHIGNTTVLTYSYQKPTGGGDVDDSGATGDINQTYLVSGAVLKEIANAIRSKTGISGALNVTGFAAAIASIEVR